jgi:hypothetical protein
MRPRDFLLLTMFAASGLAPVAPAVAETPVNAAVFEPVFINSSPLETTPEESARVAHLYDSLREALEKSGRYHLVSLAPIKDQIAEIKDIHDCNGCVEEFAQKAGAEVAVVTWVQKVSNLIININIRIEDAATGKLLKGGSVDIRGNNDVSWERGLKYLLNERVFNGAP